MRILLTNCNTTEAMTDAIAAQARAAARPGTEIVAVTPSWGPPSCEGWYDSFVSAAAVLETVRHHPDPFDALVMAGFGEHGRQGAREILSVPVLDITETATHMAGLLGGRYGVVTSLAATFPLIEASLRDAGSWGACSGLYATGIEVLELDADPDRTAAVFLREARRAVEAGADSIVLGCAGMSTLQRRLGDELDVPVIDGVAAAVAVAEAAHQLRLRRRPDPRVLSKAVARRPAPARIEGTDANGR